MSAEPCGIVDGNKDNVSPCPSVQAVVNEFSPPAINTSELNSPITPTPVAPPKSNDSWLSSPKSVCVLNCRSLINKLSLFQSFVYSSDFTFICLTETWLSDYVSDGEILPNDFALYRTDRPTRGGGVLIAVKSYVPSSSVPSPPDIEVISVEIGTNHDLVLCSIYVPPDSPVSLIFSLVFYLSNLVSSYNKCIFVGDFNFPDINWSSLLGSSMSSNVFCEFIFDCNLRQHVSQPTHKKGNTLDLVLTSPSVNIKQLSVNSQLLCDFSDHFIISFDVLFSSPSTNFKKALYVFDFSKANFTDICSFLLDFDFSVCFQSQDIEFIWSTIKSVIFLSISMFVPRINLKRNNDPKWFNTEIRHLRNCLHTMKRKHRSHPTPHRKLQIEQSETSLMCRTAQAKVHYETNLIKSFTTTNSSIIYRYIRAITDQNAIPPAITLGDRCAISDYHKACLFNEYFYYIFTKSSFQLPPPSEMLTPLSNISEIDISELDVYNALKSLDPSKASGCDNISAKILKKCAIALYQPLHHLFSLSLSQHYIPLEWRTHLIRPIFKSGERQKVSNYRPISLLCVVSKVLERLVFNNIIDFVRSSISLTQFGFLKGHSSLQQLLIFWNTVINFPQTDTIYLDFRKAFDSVSHNELLLKLWHFGITGSLWMWFRAYLSDRHQFVSIGNSRSGILPVFSGVPQGSILGPLLFLIYINDLPDKRSESSLLLFADDAKCFMPISSTADCASLQSDLSSLADWSSEWKLYFNELKCHVLRFTRSQHNVTTPSYSLNKTIISSVCIQKDLGVMLSSDMQWKPHYILIIQKAYKMLGLVRRTFPLVRDVCAKHRLYVSLIRSLLLYCSPLWRPQLLVDIKSLETVQRRATKFITENRSLDYQQRLLSLQMLPLMMEYEIADVLFLSNR